jgi:hypothetical protein
VGPTLGIASVHRLHSNLRPIGLGLRAATSLRPSGPPTPYLVSRCTVWCRHRGQNFLVSRRSVCFFLFFVVE